MPEGEEEGPHFLNFMDHCVFALDVPGNDGAKSKVEMDMFKKAECVEHGWVTVNRRSKQMRSNNEREERRKHGDVIGGDHQDAVAR